MLRLRWPWGHSGILGEGKLAVAVMFQSLRNRFKPKAPLRDYSARFSAAVSATLRAVRLFDEVWDDPDAPDESVLDLGVAMHELDDARGLLEAVRPAEKELSSLHKDMIWIVRSYSANINYTMTAAARVAEGRSTHPSLMGQAMAQALAGHQASFLDHLEELRSTRPELVHALKVSDEFIDEILIRAT